MMRQLQTILIALAATLCFRLGAQTGGTVTFANNSSTRIINGQNGAYVAASDGIQAALYWGPLGSTNLAQIDAPASVGTPLPGIFAGGTRMTGTNTAGGAVAQFQVRAWSGGYASYEEAQQHSNSLLGQSSIFQNQTGNPLADPPLPPYALVGLQSFSVTGAYTLVITCPSNITATATSSNGATVSYNTSVSGNCSPISLVCSPASGNIFPVGATTVGCSATDSCGTSNYCAFQVNVVRLPIVLTCPTNLTVTATSSNGAVVVYTNSVSGGCGATPSLVCNPPSGSTFPAGVTTVLCTATDACGTTTNCSFRVNVTRTGIALTCPANLNVTANNSNGAVVFYTNTVSGGCGGTPSLVCNPASGSTFPVGTTTVACTATDPCGTTTNCQFLVTVHMPSNAAIVLTCSSNLTVSAPGTNGAIVSFTSTATGGCSTPSVVCSPASGSRFPAGTTVVTCTASDGCGNTTNCSFQVTVICTNCGGISVTKTCPPNPVPPGGLLVFTGTVTNTGGLILSNVLVTDDQPAPNTLVFGPVTLAPGDSASFTNSYRVAACACGPFTDTLTASGIAVNHITYSNSVTATCPGTNAYAIAGDLNGDGVVDQDELNAVLSNYWAHNAIYMTNPATLGGGVFQFSLTNITGWNFTVLVSSNMSDWTSLSTQAIPVYQFFDPAAASNAPQRYYRLQYP